MDDLMNSAFFASENFVKSDDAFYFEMFSNLKTEFEFLFGAIFYKKSRNFKLAHKFENGFDYNEEAESKILAKEKNFFKIKIPINMQNATVGCFLFVRDTPFSKDEKNKIEFSCARASASIKDYEISKIFQNQLVILQDAILNKNKLTQQLELQNKKLIEIDKARSEFLANVSHELRTPLNSIIGFSTALKDGLAGEMNAKQKDYTEKILSSAIHLTGLINDILDMAKIESKAMKLNLRAQSPNSIIEEVINTIEPLAAQKNIKIETKFDFKGEIPIDFQKFKQVIYNLLGNAVKFSHENSKVIISTATPDVTSNADGVSGVRACIKIKDFGVGIAKKDQKKIFDKFVQLDNIYTKKYSSTGLGLTITREILKLHGAKISVKSELNKGAEFIIEF